MPLYINPLTFSGTITNRPGPKTPQGRAVAARNATTHGLFSRDVVLPALGEDPQAYEALADTLRRQLDPRNLVERHYAEAIAAASWRLRRLHRWQAQLFEDETLTEDERLDRLDKVLRHETALHRQINQSVKMLARDVPQLFETRARKRALADLQQTEHDCRHSPDLEFDVALKTAQHLRAEPLPDDFDESSLDNTRPAPQAPAASPNAQAQAQDRQNEPDEDEENGEDAGQEDAGQHEHQSEADPPSDEAPTGGALPPPPGSGAGGPSDRPLSGPETAKTNPAHDPPTRPSR